MHTKWMALAALALAISPTLALAAAPRGSSQSNGTHERNNQYHDRTPRIHDRGTVGNR